MNFFKHTTTFFICAVIIFASCQSKRIQPSVANEDTFVVPDIFPLEQLTGNTNSMLIEKYRNVDTTDFIKLERPVSIPRMPMRYYNEANSIQRKRSKYPEIKISNFEEVIQWLREVYNLDASFRLFYYKQVEDGFLIKNSHKPRSASYDPCEYDIQWEMLLIGHDHNILTIKRWEELPCPNMYLHIVDIRNLEVISFPGFEDAGRGWATLQDLEQNGITFASQLENSIFILFRDNFVNPKADIENRTEGTVVASFVIETDGTISDVKIIRNVSPALDREVIRLLKLTDGKWTPAVQNGKKIPIEVYLPFRFLLEENPEYYRYFERRRR